MQGQRSHYQPHEGAVLRVYRCSCCFRKVCVTIRAGTAAACSFLKLALRSSRWTTVRLRGTGGQIKKHLEPIIGIKKRLSPFNPARCRHRAGDDRPAAARQARRVRASLGCRYARRAKGKRVRKRERAQGKRVRKRERAKGNGAARRQRNSVCSSRALEE